MRMELIQPFINAADAVFSRNARRRRRKSAIFPWTRKPTDAKASPRIFSSRATSKAASCSTSLPKSPTKSPVISPAAPSMKANRSRAKTVCELANMVIGNSVTLLNDQGFRFKVFPPEIHMQDEGLAGDHDTEAMVICIDTPCGKSLPKHRHALHAPPPQRTRRRRRRLYRNNSQRIVSFSTHPQTKMPPDVWRHLLSS